MYFMPYMQYEQGGKATSRMERQTIVNTEILAIEYLKQHKIPALPGKAYKLADVDILAWGCVRVEVKYSSIRHYNHYFSFSLTRRQRQRGVLADVVLMICDYGDHRTFHLFDPDDEVFYFK